MRKWIASAIAVSMILNNGLHADTAPDITPEMQTEVHEISALPEQDGEVSAESTDESAISANTPPSDPAPLEESQAATYIEETQQEPPQFAEVGRGSSDAVKAASNRRWQRIGIAVGAVAIATIALILVSNNGGHNAH